MKNKPEEEGGENLVESMEDVFLLLLLEDPFAALSGSLVDLLLNEDIIVLIVYAKDVIQEPQPVLRIWRICNILGFPNPDL
jgi:hypothetical protein